MLVPPESQVATTRQRTNRHQYGTGFFLCSICPESFLDSGMADCSIQVVGVLLGPASGRAMLPRWQKTVGAWGGLTTLRDPRPVVEAFSVSLRESRGSLVSEPGPPGL